MLIVGVRRKPMIEVRRNGRGLCGINLYFIKVYCIFVAIEVYEVRPRIVRIFLEIFPGKSARKSQ